MKNGLLLFLLSLISALIFITSCKKSASSPSVTSIKGWQKVGDLTAGNQFAAITKDAADNIYVGGLLIDSAGNSYVAKWNGTSWSHLVFIKGPADVTCFTTDASNNVYAFIQAGTSSVTEYVAKWNGSSWVSLVDTHGGTSVTPDGLSMACDNTGNVYVAVGHQEVDKWNGTTWANITGSDTLFTNGQITSITSDTTGNIYVGIINLGHGSIPGVAKWNGSSWSPVGNVGGMINSVASDMYGNIYAGGKAAAVPVPNAISKWDGSAWTNIGGISSYNSGFGEINCITTDAAGNVYACGKELRDNLGHNIVEKWDGTSWSILNAGMVINMPIMAITVDSKGVVYGIGMFYDSSNRLFVAKYVP